uniref:Uncharacterized protein n=1 Tax=Rhizophora mucronata TaxID=61149 RepID=A0A2P2MBG7_RHIMU
MVSKQKYTLSSDTRKTGLLLTYTHNKNKWHLQLKLEDAPQILEGSKVRLRMHHENWRLK